MQPKRATDPRELPHYDGCCNFGAYDQPFSGVGKEFNPLGSLPTDTRIAIHEVGFWPKCHGWNYPGVYSPFWRLYYDFEPGHQIRFAENNVATALSPEELIVIPDHRRFDCIGKVPISKFWIHFSTTLRILPDSALPIRYSIEPVTIAIIRRLVELFDDRNNHSEVRLEQLAIALLVYLFSDSALPVQKLPDDINRVIRDINDAPGQSWSNSELARSVSMST